MDTHVEIDQVNPMLSHLSLDGLPTFETLYTPANSPVNGSVNPHVTRTVDSSSTPVEIQVGSPVDMGRVTQGITHVPQSGSMDDMIFLSGSGISSQSKEPNVPKRASRKRKVVDRVKSDPIFEPRGYPAALKEENARLKGAYENLRRELDSYKEKCDALMRTIGALEYKNITANEHIRRLEQRVSDITTLNDRQVMMTLPAISRHMTHDGTQGRYLEVKGMNIQSVPGITAPQWTMYTPGSMKTKITQ